MFGMSINVCKTDANLDLLMVSSGTLSSVQRKLRVDNNGNVFVMELNSVSQLGGTMLMFVRSFDVQNRVRGFDIDCQGYIYILFDYSGSVLIPPFTLTTPGTSSSAIAKASTVTGVFTLATQTVVPSGSSTESFDLINDLRGNVYISTRYNGTVNFGETQYIANSNDVVIAKLNNYLEWQFATLVKNNSNQAGSDVYLASDLQGNVYVTGNNQRYRIIDVLPFGIPPRTVAFVAQLTPTGLWSSVLQIVSPSGSDITTPLAIVANGQGDVFAMGDFTGTINFGNITAVSANPNNIWVSKITSDRTLHLIGAVNNNFSPGDSVFPIFNAVGSGNIYSNLTPGFEYYINSSGNITVGCSCALCADPRLTYLGTACSSTGMFINYNSRNFYER